MFRQILITVLSALLAANSAVAGHLTFPTGRHRAIFATVAASSSGSASTSDVVYYWNADSIVDGQSPQKGPGTITVGASMISTTAIVGTAAISNNNAGNSGGRFTISVSSIDFASGRIGMYVIQRDPATSAADGDPMWGATSTGTATSKFHWSVNGSGQHLFAYSDATQLNLGTGFLTQNTTAFVEFAWDYTQATLGAPCKVYVDSALIATCAGTPSAGAPTPTSLRFSGQDGNATNMTYDQVIISTNCLKDLYVLRSTTSF